MAKERFEADLKLNTENFDRSITSAQQSTKGLVESFKAVGVAGAVVAFMFKGLKGVIEDTEFAAVKMAGVGQALKQVFVELARGGGFANNPLMVSNIQEAFQIGQNIKQLQIDENFDLVDQARILNEIGDLRLDAADKTKDILTRTTALTEVEKKLLDLNVLRASSAEKMKKEALALFAMNPQSLAASQLYAKSELQLLEAGRTGIEQRRIKAEITRMELEHQKEIAEQLRLQGQYLETGYKLSKLTGTGSEPLAAEYAMQGRGMYFNASKTSPGLKNLKTQFDPERLKEITSILEEQRQTVSSLADSFASMFSDVNLGFQGMIDGMISGFKRLVMQLAAKAAILAVIGSLFPALGILGKGNFLNTLFPNLQGLGSLGMGGGNMVPIGAGAPGGIVQFKISNKDLKTAIRR